MPSDFSQLLQRLKYLITGLSRDVELQHPLGDTVIMYTVDTLIKMNEAAEAAHSDHTN